MRNKLIKNLLNKPAKLKPGQVWFIAKDSEDFPSMEMVITDTEYSDLIGIVRASALTRVKKGGDDHDVVLNKKNYSQTLPSGRVCLRFTDCALPADKFDFFIDELNTADIKKVKNSIKIKESQHTESQLRLIGNFIDRLSAFRNEATARYEQWLESQNKVIALMMLIDRDKKIKSYYGLAAANLDEVISLDNLWSRIEKNKKNINNLYEDEKLAIDFIVIDKLPHLVFYSSIKVNINSVELVKGNILSKAVDENFSVNKDGRFITILDPSKLEPGEWTLKFNINKNQKSIQINIK